MMNSKEITALVWGAAEPLAAEVGCKIWDVKFLKEAGEWILRVILDTDPPGGVTTDMCEAVSRALDPWLDEKDPIEQSYCLEVSSPGINRELYRDSDFDQFAGTMVDIKLYKPNADGKKAYTALLVGRDAETLLLAAKEGEEPERVPLAAIAQCRVHFDF